VPAAEQREKLQQVPAHSVPAGVVVYAKPPFGGAEHVLHYLARYTHRVAISNHRLLAVSDTAVVFRWKNCRRARTTLSVLRAQVIRNLAGF